MENAVYASGMQRERQFRRTALLYFLPLAILNFLAGTKVMASSPGLFPNEHLIGVVFAGMLSLAMVMLWRDARRLEGVSYFLCACLASFFVYRETSILFGPSSMDETKSIFMPLYGYFALVYFAFLIFLPRSLSERCCWLFWAIMLGQALARLLPEWSYFATRSGAADLLVYLLIANPMFILLGRVMIRVQTLLLESELEVAHSRRELQLLDEVARSRQRFERAVDGSRDGLWEWREEEHPLVWLSPQVYRLLGITRTTLPCNVKSLTALVHEDHRDEVLQHYQQAIDLRSRFETECLIRTEPDGYQWFALKGVASAEGPDQHLRIAGSLQSIHARKQAEQQLIESNRALSHFASVAAHDLRAPLRKVSTYADLVERNLGEQSERTARHLESIKRQVLNMDELIERLLSYASSNAPATPERVDLNRELRQVIDTLEPQIRQRDARVEAQHLPAACCNPGDIRQVFQNLISNALKFCEQKPRIEIYSRSEAGSGTVEIAIRDNGIGIAADDLERICKPLARLHSKADYEGHGLGLATVVSIVERTGGRLIINSEPGEGSEFIICLPLADQ